MNQLRKLNFTTPCRRLKGHLPKICARGGVVVKEGGSVRRCILISARFAKNYNCVHGHFSLNWQTQVCCQCCLPASTSVCPLTSSSSVPTFYALGSVIPTPSHCLTASYSSYSTESDKNFFDCGQTHARMGKKSERERDKESESGKERDG